MRGNKHLPSLHPPPQPQSRQAQEQKRIQGWGGSARVSKNKSQWNVLRFGCRVTGKCTAFHLPSQSEAQSADLRNASKIFHGLSQSLVSGVHNSTAKS